MRRRRKAQMELEMGWVQEGTVLYENAVLVTSLDDEIFTLAQHYRERGDAENNFDELKNQWGWLGFTKLDHARSEMMTLFVALVYNWWSLFTRLSTFTNTPKRLHHARCCCTPSDARPVTATNPR